MRIHIYKYIYTCIYIYTPTGSTGASAMRSTDNVFGHVGHVTGSLGAVSIYSSRHERQNEWRQAVATRLEHSSWQMPHKRSPDAAESLRVCR